jgi:drug/metabolite transporter (DMT)-like permease
VLGLSLLCSGVAYLLYYRLIADLGPTKALTVTFLMPVFGIAWGALFLGEGVRLAMLAGCASILAGTGLVVARR